jgi:hypothetical protein
MRGWRLVVGVDRVTIEIVSAVPSNSELRAGGSLARDLEISRTTLPCRFGGGEKLQVHERD